MKTNVELYVIGRLRGMRSREAARFAGYASSVPSRKARRMWRDVRILAKSEDPKAKADYLRTRELELIDRLRRVRDLLDAFDLMCGMDSEGRGLLSGIVGTSDYTPAGVPRSASTDTAGVGA